MTGLQSLLFVAFFVGTLTWVVCTVRISRQLRDRHPETYDELGIADLWPRTLWGWGHHWNGRPTWALLRFLIGGHWHDLHDPDLSSLSAFMRGLFFANLLLLAALAFTIVRAPPPPAKKAAIVTAASPLSEAQALYAGAMAKWRSGHLEPALADLRAVIRLEPGNFQAHLQADRLLSSQKRFDEAIALWTEYLKWTPMDAQAWFERGGAHYQKHDIPAARSDAVRACELGQNEACRWAERFKE